MLFYMLIYCNICANGFFIVYQDIVVTTFIAKTAGMVT